MAEVQKTGKAVSFPGGLELIVYCKDKMTKLPKKEKCDFQIHIFTLQGMKTFTHKLVLWREIFFIFANLESGVSI